MSTPRRLLAQAGLRPKKRYAQNFLENMPAARKIARLSISDAAPDRRMLEIGAGTGTLTLALIEEGANLTAIEIDPDLVALLRSRDDLASRVHPARRRADVRLSRLVVGNDDGASPETYRITSRPRWCFVWSRWSSGPDSLTVMLQKDVADRLAASPGTPAYGSLSVAVQYAMQVQPAVHALARIVFPAAESAFQRRAAGAARAACRRAARPRAFWKVVRGAFAYRRKTLVEHSRARTRSRSSEDRAGARAQQSLSGASR